MITNLYKDLLTITRNSPSLLDPIAATPVINPDRQPSIADVYLNIKGDGNTSSGTVRVIGSNGAVSINELLAMDVTGYCPLSVNKFDLIDHLELSGIYDGLINMDQVRAQGEPILSEIVIKTVWGSVVAKSGNLRALQAGEIDQAKYVMATMDDAALTVLRDTFVYVQQGEQAARKFRLTFLTPPGRMGNINGDLFLIDSQDVVIPT